MATALWTFEENTTTGFEGSVDTIAGITMYPQGDEDPLDPDKVPCPTVPGHTGSGRLLASAGLYNAFATDKELGLAYTAGNSISLSFWWRPLLEYGFPGPTCMFFFSLQGYDAGGSVGLFSIDVSFLNSTTPGEVDIKIATPGATTFSGVPLSIRDWHEVELTYNGAGTLELFIDGGSVGTKAFVVSTAARGRVNFARELAVSGSVYGVLDTVELTLA